ncbi:MAG: hypothetical protein Q8P18_16210 [Pseudomonadota bacterium]|nr:hypothetical protein [Pseudomonadota bacterium]
MRPPLSVDVIDAEVEFADGLVAQGAGRVSLLTPLGPTLTFAGEFHGSGFDVIRTLTQPGGPVHGELFPMPDRRATARAGDLTILGSHIRAIRQCPYSMSRSPVPIEGEYLMHRCRVGAEVVPDDAVVDVHHIGRGLRHYLFPAGSAATGGIAGLPIAWRGHTFVLREPERGVREAAPWAEVGTFTVMGPATPGTDAWWNLIWPFTLVLGSAVGCPIDVAGWDAFAPERARWLASEWRPRGKVHDTGCPMPVGRVAMEGGHRDLAEWVAAGLRSWDEWGPMLGLEVALLYLENAPGQAEPEIRCRDLVNAIERLLIGVCRARGAPRSNQISQNLQTVERLLGRGILTGGQDGERSDLSRFRNRLAHDGGLLDDRDGTMEERQRLVDAEGWLTTCCYRVLAAIFGADVPLRDLTARGLPRRRPSEGGFTRSPFVPVQAA